MLKLPLVVKFLQTSSDSISHSQVNNKFFLLSSSFSFGLYDSDATNVRKLSFKSIVFGPLIFATSPSNSTST